jgi:hypothetical protein
MIFIHQQKSWQRGLSSDNIVNVDWNIVNKFNEILYNRIGLVIDVKATYDAVKAKDGYSDHYYLILRSPDYDYYYESSHTLYCNYKEDKLINLAGWIVNEYYDKIDNQGNKEFVPLSQLPDVVYNSSYSNHSRDDFVTSVLCLVNNKISCLKNELHNGLSNVVRY